LETTVVWSNGKLRVLAPLPAEEPQTFGAYALGRFTKESLPFGGESIDERSIYSYKRISTRSFATLICGEQQDGACSSALLAKPFSKGTTRLYPCLSAITSDIMQKDTLDQSNP
jgi:hypothetical protein